jgi:hypothetical protein
MQVVLVLLLVLVLENSRYLTVTLIERSSAGRFGPCFDAGSQQIEHQHDYEHEHDSLTSESGLKTERCRDASSRNGPNDLIMFGSSHVISQELASKNPKLDRQSFFIHLRPPTSNREAQLFKLTRNPSKNY